MLRRDWNIISLPLTAVTAHNNMFNVMCIHSERCLIYLSVDNVIYSLNLCCLILPASQSLFGSLWFDGLFLGSCSFSTSETTIQYENFPRYNHNEHRHNTGAPFFGPILPAHLRRSSCCWWISHLSFWQPIRYCVFPTATNAILRIHSSLMRVLSKCIWLRYTWCRSGLFYLWNWKWPWIISPFP